MLFLFFIKAAFLLKLLQLRSVPNFNYNFNLFSLAFDGIDQRGVSSGLLQYCRNRPCKFRNQYVLIEGRGATAYQYSNQKMIINWPYPAEQGKNQLLSLIKRFQQTKKTSQNLLVLHPQNFCLIAEPVLEIFKYLVLDLTQVPLKTLKNQEKSCLNLSYGFLQQKNITLERIFIRKSFRQSTDGYQPIDTLLQQVKSRKLAGLIMTEPLFAQQEDLMKMRR